MAGNWFEEVFVGQFDERGLGGRKNNDQAPDQND
jgi:hypothetical protein